MTTQPRLAAFPAQHHKRVYHMLDQLRQAKRLVFYNLCVGKWKKLQTDNATSKRVAHVLHHLKLLRAAHEKTAVPGSLGINMQLQIRKPPGHILHFVQHDRPVAELIPKTVRVRSSKLPL